MSHLFDPFTLRGVTLRNRIGVSPMCQYSAEGGLANDWHLAHLGARAVGGAGLIVVEATAVEARGRITPHDLGLWSDAHIEPLARIARFMTAHGATPAIQLAHAGRKASSKRPWDGVGGVSDADGGWEPMAPSDIAFRAEYRQPRALSLDEIRAVQLAFRAAALRALAAGFEWVEIHAAHGYLLHSFLSPLSNHRDDAYGGPFENRVRMLIEVARAVREVWPAAKPLAARLSCTDWVDGGWALDDSIALARLLRAEGVDLIDCSSGGAVLGAKVPIGPGYQVPFAEAIRRQAGIATAAVGMITQPTHADEIVRNGRADLVLIGREMLRDPNWPIRAAQMLRHDPKPLVPSQYALAH